MKKSFLIIYLLLITFLLSAQNSGYFDYIYFDTPDSTLKIDTSIVGNIWQIGRPHKTIFDSAFSPPNVIITDTIHYYPANNFSAFIIKIFDPSWGLYYSDETVILFKHKYDTDSLMDGGYIEISYDNCLTWNNIINDTFNMWMPDIYSQYDLPNPTIENGNAAFTGSSLGWINTSINGCTYMSLNTYPVYLRFVFSSDSIQTNKEGWMIDNLFVCVGCSSCLGVKEFQDEESISIFPNPVSAELKIIVKQKSAIEILNIAGQIVKTINNAKKETTIDISNLSSAVYIIRAKTDKEIITKKFIKQ